MIKTSSYEELLNSADNEAFPHAGSVALSLESIIGVGILLNNDVRDIVAAVVLTLANATELKQFDGRLSELATIMAAAGERE